MEEWQDHLESCNQIIKIKIKTLKNEIDETSASQTLMCSISLLEDLVKMQIVSVRAPDSVFLTLR